MSLLRPTLVAALLAAPCAASAQVRPLALTGAPLAILDEPFTTVAGVRELPGGKAIIADRQEKTIALADFGANAITKIGRTGGGPGEFQMPFGVFAGPGASSLVPDPLANKAHVIEGGKITKTHLGPDGSHGVFLQVRGTDRLGRIYYEGMPAFSESGVGSDSVPILRWNPATKKVDTMAMLRAAAVPRLDRTGPSSGSISMRVAPFQIRDSWVPLPDGRIAIARQAPYRIDIVEAPRRIRAGAPVSYTPIKVTQADKDAMKKQLTQGGNRPQVMAIGGARASGGGAPGGNAVPSGTTFNASAEVADEDWPAVKPAFNGSAAAQVTPEGEIWVLRTRAAGDPAPSYDIFDTAGRLTGRATLKPSSAVVGFGAGVVYVARQDKEDDLRYLEKYAR